MYLKQSSLRAHAMDQFWWRRTGSNRRPEACKATALPTELRPLKTEPSNESKSFQRLCWSESRAPNLVGLGRLELPTSRLSGVRSNRTELQAPVAITRLGYASMRKRNEDGDVLLINLPFPADINASFERRVQ